MRTRTAASAIIYRNTGGMVAYTNLTNRWNWGVSGGQVPYLTGYTTAGVDDHRIRRAGSASTARRSAASTAASRIR